ncbi:MAG: hypothetical protein FWE67_04180, partial [Planctomycetaceae bacterium]|nr:hypothetical protein [Planctomycetaceae bacterium]
DFPRVPYPDDVKTFWRQVELGGKLRRLHLMEEVVSVPDLANYPIAGTNRVETIRYAGGKVYINETQYFDNIPASAWDFFIGGYQPAQKWLKDRKGKVLSFAEIEHYQQIIAVLCETETIMEEIDDVLQGCGD